MRIIVTGGAGFIGSAFVKHLLNHTGNEVLNLDKLTYASSPEAAKIEHPRYHFERLDICEVDAVQEAFRAFGPEAVVHLAAETHVDRSIDGPTEFLRTNVFGTFALLEAARRWWQELECAEGERFRFLHVSTDEVYGDLGSYAAPFAEISPYQPSSPYSASKAGSDHLVRAWHRTYGLPVLVSNCSNNYGPRQFPEKLVPLVILNAVEGRPLPVYGDGLQVRDWLYVEDHADALFEVLTRGHVGETYNIGGLSERRNIDVVRELCAILEEERPKKPPNIARYTDLIKAVADRPGHDRRYAIDCSKIEAELGWRPKQTFESGIRLTVPWYLENLDWCAKTKARYSGDRLGLGNGEQANAA